MDIVHLTFLFTVTVEIVFGTSEVMEGEGMIMFDITIDSVIERSVTVDIDIMSGTAVGRFINSYHHDLMQVWLWE